MTAAITSLVSNPRVGYHLDPGEPGVAPPATATNSAYTVVAQESRNRARLASQAMLEGRDILLVKTDYQVARVGSFDVVVGGHTTVVSRERPDKANSATAANRQQGQSSTNSAQSQQVIDPQKVAQLTAEQRQLEQERSDLKASETGGASDDAFLTKARLVAIDQRLSEIGTELRKLGVNNTASNLSPAMAFATRGFSAALDATGQLLDLIG